MVILTRPHTPEDIRFIFHSYLTSWRNSKWAGTMSNRVYYDTQRQTLEELMGRGATVLIAHPADHPDKILGWVCGEVKDGRCVLHYLFLRDSGFESAVREALMSAVPGSKPGFITHRLSLPRLWDWVHAPEIARRESL